MMARYALLLTLMLVTLMLAACSDDVSPEAVDDYSDAGADAAEIDTGLDAGLDPVDLGADAASPSDAADMAADTAVDAADGGDPDMATPDRTCDPGNLVPGTYDPDCVYLLGTLLPGSAGTSVFTYPGSGEVHYGFGNYAKHPVIRPTDGKLIFGEFDTWHVFEPDVVRLPGDPRPDYPSDPLANDPLVSAPACDTVGFGTYRVDVFPDDGALAYACFNDGAALYLGGTSDPLGVSSEDVAALGAERQILVDETAGPAIVKAGNSTPVTGIRSFERFIAARWIDGRFVAAVFHEYRPPDIEMWSIEPDGTATSLGAVQLSPDVDSYFQDCVLNPAAELFCFATAAGTLQDKIVVFRVGAEPETVFTEPDGGVSIHISYLATGP